MSMMKCTRLAIILLPVLFTLSAAQNENAQKQAKNEKNVQAKKADSKTAQKKVSKQSPKPLSAEHIRKALTKIGVNERTIEKIVSLTQEFSGFSQKKRLLVHREELNIKEALLSGTTDISVIEPFVKQKAALVAEIELAQIQRDLKIKSLLTSEEYVKLKKIYQSRTTAKKSVPPKKRPEPEQKPADGQ